MNMRAERQSPSRHDLEISPEEKQDSFVVEEVEKKDWEDCFRFLYTYPYNEDVFTGAAALNVSDFQKEADVKQQMAYMQEDGSKSLFFIRDNGEIVAVATAIFESKEDTGNLRQCKVKPGYRGKGLAKLLTDARIEKARKLGYKKVDVFIDKSNPLSLVSKLNQGFYIGDYDSEMFDLYKDINNDSEKFLLSRDAQEVSLGDMDAVKAALDDGWIGVDIKNVYEENGETIVAPSDDLNPAHWTLILRKKEPKLELVS